MIYYYQSEGALDRLLKTKINITKPSNRYLRFLLVIFYSYFIPLTQIYYAFTMIFIQNFEAGKYYNEQQQINMNEKVIIEYSIEYYIHALYVTMAIHGLLIGLFFLNYVFYVVFNWKYYFYGSIFDVIAYATSVPANLMQIRYAQNPDKELFSGYIKLMLVSCIFSYFKGAFSALAEYHQGQERTVFYIVKHTQYLTLCAKQNNSKVGQHRPNETNNAIN